MIASVAWALLSFGAVTQSADIDIPLSVSEEVRVTPQGVNLHSGGGNLTLLLDDSQRVWIAFEHVAVGSLAFWRASDEVLRQVDLPEKYRSVGDSVRSVGRAAVQTFVNDGKIQVVLFEHHKGVPEFRIQKVAIADYSPESNSLTPCHEIDMTVCPELPYKTLPMGRKADWNPTRVLPVAGGGYLLVGEYTRTYLSQALLLDENAYHNFFAVFWKDGVYGSFERISHGGRSSAWGWCFAQLADGTTYVSWQRQNHPFQFDQRIYCAQISPNGIAAKPREVGAGFSNQAIALSRDDIYLFWIQMEDDARQDGQGAVTSGFRAVCVERKAGTWSDPISIPFPALDSYDGERTPQIAACAGPNGSLFVAFELAGELYFTMRLGGTWRAPIALDSPVGEVCRPQLTVDVDGIVHLAYLKRIRNFGSDPEAISHHDFSFNLERSELDSVRPGGFYSIGIYRRLVPTVTTGGKDMADTKP